MNGHYNTIKHVTFENRHRGGIGIASALRVRQFLF